jgi:DNA helicase-2/ATP-dependent DNA helicase PcrA
MRPKHFTPTAEQKRVIYHGGSAFVSACPGAGKTRVLVERARVLLNNATAGKGIAFLSFTTAAVSELEQRLRREGLLPTPVFPHFIGTFDSFIWQFLVSPFGVSGCAGPPRLIPDKNQLTVRPYQGAREVPLECFCRATGEIIPAVAARLRFNPSPGLARAYRSNAASTRRRLFQRGELDFEDARALAADRLESTGESSILATALAGRFLEVIVDETQDCNPSDLEIVHWLRSAGIIIKVVCDPDQSIYAFRGGVTDELVAFRNRFIERDHLSLSGNFRSSDPICKAIVSLRRVDAKVPDRAIGVNASITTPVRILAYPSNRVPASVGARFRELVKDEGIDPTLCPVLAATWHSGAQAIGQPNEATSQDTTLRLANAVTNFHYASDSGNRKEALEQLHSVVLSIEGKLGANTYHQYLASEDIQPGTWRPQILALLRELRYDPSTYSSPDAWHARAKSLLERHLPHDGRSISQILRRHARLTDVLVVAPPSNLPVKTIHSVKGMEFPAVCVIMTVPTTKGIMDYLETGAPAASSEDARKIYVAASRAQQLLVIAVPRTQAGRLEARLAATNTAVTVLKL